ncbi:MAG: hypothetical protein NTX50_03155 [Candidatus Sumerlaeota bacterium]|nr:hypothetical protein [Candidatus Sumerlaeota bacterium]
MRFSLGHHPTARRGFTFIGLIFVLIIIAILAGGYFSGTPDAPIGAAKLGLDRSKDITCKVNRDQLRTQVTMWQINNSGQKPTLQALKAAAINTERLCPEGGVFSIGANGEVYCSKHNPEPAAEAANPVPSAPTPPTPPGPARTPAPTAPARSSAAPTPEPGSENIGLLGIERAKALSR